MKAASSRRTRSRSEPVPGNRETTPAFRSVHSRIAAVWLTFWAIVPNASTGQAQQSAAPVGVAPVVERDVAPRQAFVANVQPNRRSVIGSAVDGRVLRFLVDAGEPVEAQQPLAELRTTTIKIELAAAEAELELRRAELRELENGSRPEEIALAEASVRAARAANDYAQSKFARVERLLEKGSGVSRDEFESIRAEALRAVATVAETGSTLELVRQGPRVEQIDQAKARVAVQEQVVQQLRDRIEKYTIRSPFAGFVAAELTEAGAWVQQGDSVAEVVEVDPVEVEVYVPASNIHYVDRGDPATVTVDAFPESFTGEVDRIVPIADGRSRSFPVRIVVQNPKVNGRHRLLPGMLANVSLPTEAARTRLLIPKDALQLGGKQPSVLKVVDGKVVLVPVKTGPPLGGWLSVDPLSPSTLSADDVVVSRGNERLRPGQPVTVTSREDPPNAELTDG